MKVELAERRAVERQGIANPTYGLFLVLKA